MNHNNLEVARAKWGPAGWIILVHTHFACYFPGVLSVTVQRLWYHAGRADLIYKPWQQSTCTCGGNDENHYRGLWRAVGKRMFGCQG